MVAQVETKSTKTIPYVRGYPFVGNIPELTKDRLKFLARMTRVSDVCGCHLGPFSTILFNKAEYAHAILVEHASDFYKGRLMHRVFDSSFSGKQGVFISEGEFHRRQRKLMSPPFQPRHIASYADTMVGYTEQLLQEWRDGETIDVNQEMTKVTMSIIGKILFDADVFTEADELGEAVTITLENAVYRFTHLLAPPLNWPTPRNIRVRAAGELLRERIQHMIDERRQSGKERNDFLSILLHARYEDGGAMDDEQLMEECLTLFAAGHETTATTLTWAWHLLCQHPDAYRKVQQEVDSVLQGRTPTYADVEHLPYCLQVFKEAMRLYPAAYSIAREALHDVDINGYVVPKGHIVLISPYTLHRKPEYFAEPEKFVPERFAPEREKQIPRYAYLPFGAGPRICIGNYFATMEGHLLLAMLAQKVVFTLEPGQTIEPDLNHHLTMRPGGKVNMVVSKRQLAL